MKKAPTPKTTPNGISIRSHTISLASAWLMPHQCNPTFFRFNGKSYFSAPAASFTWQSINDDPVCRQHHLAAFARGFDQERGMAPPGHRARACHHARNLLIGVLGIVMEKKE